MTNATQNRQPEAVDRLLGDYFKSQMPKQWPAAPRAGGARPAATPATDTLTPSRWALAASVALLIGGGWFVTQFADNGKSKTTTNFEKGEADVKHLKDLGKKTR